MLNNKNLSKFNTSVLNISLVKDELVKVTQLLNKNRQVL